MNATESDCSSPNKVPKQQSTLFGQIAIVWK